MGDGIFGRLMGRKRAWRSEVVCAPYLILSAPDISMCYVLGMNHITCIQERSVVINTSKRKGIQVIQIESTQI